MSAPGELERERHGFWGIRFRSAVGIFLPAASHIVVRDAAALLNWLASGK